MREETAGDQVVGVYLSIASTADDVIETDGGHPHRLSDECNRQTNHRREPEVRKKQRRLGEEEHVGQRENPIAIVEKKITKSDHYFTAMMPPKLYHLKKTSV